MVKTFHDRGLLKESSLLLSKISGAVYDLPNTPSISDWVQKETLIDGTGQYRVAILESTQHPNEFVIGFKGTSSMKDYIVDAGIGFVPFIPLSGKKLDLVHVGFFALYISLRKKLFKFMQNHKEAKFHITGHSLGGALAKLFIYDIMVSLKPNDIPNIICVTFAAPKIGTYNTADSFEKIHKKLTKKGLKINYINDIIVKDLVPWYPGVGYFFAGEYRYINTGSAIEHSIASYIKYIENYYDDRDRDFNVIKRGKATILKDGLLTWNRKDLIDLVPGYQKLSSVFPQIETIIMKIDPGPFNNYTILIHGRAKGMKRIFLHFHFENGGSVMYDIFDGRLKWHGVHHNGGKISRIDYWKQF